MAISHRSSALSGDVGFCNSLPRTGVLQGEGDDYRETSLLTADSDFEEERLMFLFKNVRISLASFMAVFLLTALPGFADIDPKNIRGMWLFDEGKGWCRH